MTPEELQARIRQLQAERSGQPSAVSPEPAVAPQAPVQEAQPVAPIAQEQPPVPQEQGGDWLGSDPYADGSASSGFVISNDPFKDGAEPEETETGEAPRTAVAAIEAFGDKEELSAADIVNLPFEEIVKLADISSPLEYKAKKQLADAIQGNVPGTLAGRIGQSVGLPVGPSDESRDLFEQVLSKKSEFDRSEDAPGQLSRLGSSILYGDQYAGQFGDNQALMPTGQAQALSTLNAMTGEWGDELLGALGAERGQRAVRAANQQLDDNDVVGDAIISDIIGLAAPSTAAARAVGLGAQGVGAAGNVARSALIGGVEGGISGSGAADDGDRLAAGIDGVMYGVGAGVGGELALRTGGAVYRAIRNNIGSTARQNKASRNALSGVQRTVKRIAGDKIDLTQNEILDSIAEGVPLQRLLTQKGMREDQIQEVVNNLTGGSRRLLNELYQIRIGVQSRTATSQANEVTRTGRALEQARDTNITPDGIVSVNRRLLNSEQGSVFHDQILLPTVRTRVGDSDSIARAAGYGNNAAEASRNVHIDRSSGEMFVVRKNSDGKVARPDKDGNYKPDDLYQIEPSGDFLYELQTASSALSSPNLRSGEPVNQVRGFAVLDPLTRSIEQGERRVGGIVGEASDANRAARLRQEATAAGRRGAESTSEYVADLQSIDGMPTTLNADQKRSLEFLAREASALSGFGRQGASNTALQQAGSAALGSARVGGIFGGSLGSAARVTALSMGLRKLSSIIGVGSSTALSAAERRVLPAMRALIEADDAVLAQSMREAVEAGTSSVDDVVNILSKNIPAFGAAMASANATTHVTGNQQNLLGEID